MENRYRYRITAGWTGARNGWVDAENAPDTLHFSAPREFQGEPGHWTPEDFFVAAIGSCFVSTFSAIADFSKFKFTALEIEVEGYIEKQEGGFRFTQVVVRPMLTIEDAEAVERGIRLLEKAERACLVSRSLSTPILLEPTVEVASPALA